MNKNQTHISKFISKILRHAPEIISITLDSEGWTSTIGLLDGMRKEGKTVEISDLEIVVSEDDKGRYSFNNDKSMLRANQGHNKQLNNVKLSYTALQSHEVPNWLYHGTDSRFLEAIFKEGLKSMERQHVHLTDSMEMANNVGGRRKKSDTETKLLKISTKEAMNAGIIFYRSENDVFLADSIPAWLLR